MGGRFLYDKRIVRLRFCVEVSSILKQDGSPLFKTLSQSYLLLREGTLNNKRTSSVSEHCSVRVLMLTYGQFRPVRDKRYRDVTAQGFYGIRPTNSKWDDSAVFVLVPRLFDLYSNLLIFKGHDGFRMREHVCGTVHISSFIWYCSVSYCTRLRFISLFSVVHR